MVEGPPERLEAAKLRTMAAMEVSLSIHELSERTGVAPRTIRCYIAWRMLPRVDVRGRATRYGREHFVRLLFIKRALDNGGGRGWIRAELRKRSLESLEEELGLVAPPTGPSHAAEDALVAAERWARVPLLPGLDLVLRDDAAPMVRRIAREIQRAYAVSSGGGS